MNHKLKILPYHLFQKKKKNQKINELFSTPNYEIISNLLYPRSYLFSHRLTKNTIFIIQHTILTLGYKL